MKKIIVFLLIFALFGIIGCSTKHKTKDNIKENNTTYSKTETTNKNQIKYAGELILLPDELQKLGYDAKYEKIQVENSSCQITELTSLKKDGKDVTIFDIPKTFTYTKYSFKITRIGIGVFRGARFLKKVTIPDSVTEIGSNAFYDCSSLTAVTIPESITLIEDNAFYNCTSINSITIPDSVTTIQTDAFKNVPHIEYHGTATGAPWGAKSIN